MKQKLQEGNTTCKIKGAFKIVSLDQKNPSVIILDKIASFYKHISPADSDLVELTYFWCS